MSTTITDPTISIDRNSKSWAAFDGFTLLHEFTPYTDENTAIQEAIDWFKPRCSEHPRLVFPRITSMRISR